MNFAFANINQITKFRTPEFLALPNMPGHLVSNLNKNMTMPEKKSHTQQDCQQNTRFVGCWSDPTFFACFNNKNDPDLCNIMFLIRVAKKKLLSLDFIEREHKF